MAVTQTTKEIECFYYDQFNFISRFALSLLVKKHFLPLNAVTRFQLFAEDEHKRYEIKAQIPLSQDHTEKKKTVSIIGSNSVQAIFTFNCKHRTWNPAERWKIKDELAKIALKDINLLGENELKAFLPEQMFTF